MLEILKQIAMYNLVKQSGYTQVVALSIFHLCFPKKQVLILITKAESKSKRWLCLSLVAFVSSFFPVFLGFLTVPDFKSSSWVVPHSLGDAPGASHALGCALGFLQQEPAQEITAWDHSLKPGVSSVHPSAIAMSALLCWWKTTFLPF